MRTDIEGPNALPVPSGTEDGAGSRRSRRREMRSRRHSLLPIAAVMAGVLGSFGLSAVASAGGGAVTDVAVTTTSSSVGATGVTYVADFVATDALSAGTDTVSVQAPAGVVFPTDSVCDEYQVTDLTTGATTACVPLQSGAGTNSIVIAAPNVNAGDQVRVAVNGVTNPGSPESGTLSVSTSADPTAVAGAPALDYVAATSVTNANFTQTSTEAGATAVSYRLTFVATSAMTTVDYSLPMSSVTLDAPSGVVFPSDTVCHEYDVIDLTSGAEVGTSGCGQLISGAGTNQVTIAAPDVGVGDMVMVGVNGITNPTSPGTGSLTVSSTSDPQIVTVPDDTTAASGVEGVIVTTPSDGTGAVNLQVGFVSPSGLTAVDYGLAMSTITLDAEAGVVFPADSACDSYRVIDLTNGETGGCSALQSGAGTNEVVLLAPNVSPGDQLAVSIDGVTTPVQRPSVTAWTTSDPVPVGPVSTSTSKKSLGKVSFTTSSSSAGATNVVDQVRFTAPIAQTGEYEIWLKAPAGTVFPPSNFSSRYVITDLDSGATGGTGIDNYTVDVEEPNEVEITDAISYEAPDPNLAAGDQVVLTVSDITNPTKAKSGKVTIWASFAKKHINVPNPIHKSTAVADTVFSTSSSAAGATGVTDMVRFTASQALTSPYSITLTAPAGTVFPASDAGDQDNYLLEDLTTEQSGGTGLNWYNVSGNGTNQVVITDTIPDESPEPSIEPGDQVVLTVNNVTNPTTKAAGTLLLSTSSDPSAVSINDPVTAQSAVQAVAFTTSSTTSGATGVSDCIRFTAVHSGTSSYTITVTAPAGTVFPASSASDQDNYIIENLTTGESGGYGLNWYNISGAGTNQVVVTDTIPDEPSEPFFNPGDQMLLTINNVTNPTSTQEATIATSSDPAPVSFGPLVSP